jgi:hypothetical protein
VTYQQAWFLVFAAGTIVTILTALLLGFAIVVTNTLGSIVFGLVGLAAAIGYGCAYVKLWRARPSTRSR